MLALAVFTSGRAIAFDRAMWRNFLLFSIVKIVLVQVGVEIGASTCGKARDSLDDLVEKCQSDVEPLPHDAVLAKIQSLRVTSSQAVSRIARHRITLARESLGALCEPIKARSGILAGATENLVLERVHTAAIKSCERLAFLTT